MDGSSRKMRISLLSSVLFCILVRTPCECQILEDLEEELELLTEKYISLSLERKAGSLNRSKR